MSLTLKPESDEAKMFEVDVSDLQEDVSISGGKVTGTLKFLSGPNAITNVWGEGYFLAYTLADNTFTGLDSVKVGLQPSAGSGLAEIINDPDKNGIAKVSDKALQKFVIVQTKGTETKTQAFDLTGLTLEEPEG